MKLHLIYTIKTQSCMLSLTSVLQVNTYGMLLILAYCSSKCGLHFVSSNNLRNYKPCDNSNHIVLTFNSSLNINIIVNKIN